MSRLETGNTEPGLFVVLRLCRALGITPGDLLDDFTLGALRLSGCVDFRCQTAFTAGRVGNHAYAAHLK